MLAASVCVISSLDGHPSVFGLGYRTLVTPRLLKEMEQSGAEPSNFTLSIVVKTLEEQDSGSPTFRHQRQRRGCYCFPAAVNLRRMRGLRLAVFLPGSSLRASKAGSSVLSTGQLTTHSDSMGCGRAYACKENALQPGTPKTSLRVLRMRAGSLREPFREEGINITVAALSGCPHHCNDRRRRRLALSRTSPAQDVGQAQEVGQGLRGGAVPRAGRMLRAPTSSARAAGAAGTATKRRRLSSLTPSCARVSSPENRQQLMKEQVPSPLKVCAGLISACFHNGAPKRALEALAEMKSWPNCDGPLAPEPLARELAKAFGCQAQTAELTSSSLNSL